MSYTRVCIHYVWSTKFRKPTLVQPYRNMLFDHMRENAEKKSIYIDRLNGYTDHVHCLVWLKHGQTIDGIAFLLKGESAHWFNTHPEIKGIKLQWQTMYFAVSVSIDSVDRVRAYIDKQEVHHKMKTFEKEYQEFMKYESVVNDLDALKRRK